jgi:hypothetical protein
VVYFRETCDGILEFSYKIAVPSTIEGREPKRKIKTGQERRKERRKRNKIPK